MFFYFFHYVIIIILLILAGVTLGLLLSDGGLIDKTKQAIAEHEKAQEKEQEELGKTAGMMSNLIDGLGGTGGTTPTGFKFAGSEGDKVCNIYDMAGNLTEWTTESSSYSNSNFGGDNGIGFRLLLYSK